MVGKPVCPTCGAGAKYRSRGAYIDGSRYCPDPFHAGAGKPWDDDCLRLREARWNERAAVGKPEALEDVIRRESRLAVSVTEQYRNRTSQHLESLDAALADLVEERDLLRNALSQSQDGLDGIAEERNNLRAERDGLVEERERLREALELIASDLRFLAAAPVARSALNLEGDEP